MTLIDIGRKLSLINFSLLLFFGFSSHAQSSKDFAVLARVEINRSTPSISIKWPQLTDVVNYQIYRKGKTETTWGTVKATVAGTDTMWIDTAIIIGSEYEYYIIKTKADLSNGFTYLLGGIDIPVVHSRGNVLVVVEKTLSDSLNTELNSYYKDLAADGWNVYSITVNKTDSIQTVRRAIQQKDAQLGGLKSLIILGHVPVPYSGNFAPDGHGDHAGVWPTDAYYAIDYNNWADATYKVTGITRTENQNLPNDGKYDNTTLPGVVKYQTGRIDLSNMPKFSQSEVQLTKQYLKKDHDFRYKITKTVEKGIVDDNFSYTLGAFGSTGWRDFSVMFGANNVSAEDYFTACRNENILFAYGAGDGTYQSADGIGNTDSFTTQKGAIFNMLFGSYFGDWDNANNFLRAPLAAAENGLTSAWSGRPYWVNHAMALGEPIGNSVITTQNNKGTYQDNLYKNTVPIGLMGDPTLRLHIIAPPNNVEATPMDSNTTVKLKWNAANESGIIGYNIYRSNTSFNNYTLVNTSPVTDTFFVDNLPYNDTNYYLVKTLKLTQSASGTYYNLSQGTQTNINGIIRIYKPVVITKNATLYTDNMGNASLTINDINNGSYCNCVIGSYSLSKSNFNCSNIGVSKVYLTISDTLNNSSTDSAYVTIIDSLKPNAIAKNITISLVNGKADIIPSMINNGSFDNCGISSISVTPNSFNCNNIGDNTVTLTVVDNNGNTKETSSTVTINGTIPSVNIYKKEPNEFCQNSPVILQSTVSETISYLWSNNQTTSNINATNSGNYSLIGTNGIGCSDTATIYYQVSDNVSQYTILVKNQALLGNTSKILSGGVGSLGYNGKIETSNNSEIVASGTFAKAKTINILTGSSINNAISGDSVKLTLPNFVSNPCNNNQGNTVKVRRNTTITLSDSIYRSITVDNDATINFTSPIIYISKLTTENNVTLNFSTCSKISFCDAVTIGSNNKINSDNKSIKIFTPKVITIDNGTVFKGSIYSQDAINLTGDANSRITMNGLFIAKNLTSNYSDFNWNTTCTSCGNSNKRTITEDVITNLDDISIYPNPSEMSTNIFLNSKYEGLVKIKVIGITGNLLYADEKNKLKEQTEISLDISHFPEGIYFVKVEYGNMVKTIKLFRANN